jgi:hypothetical protein
LNGKRQRKHKDVNYFSHFSNLQQKYFHDVTTVLRES